MKLGVLFSGGKDSTYALQKAMEKEQVACLISIIPENKESYMFHTPNIEITALQSEAIGLPLVSRDTPGRKEEELSDLEAAIQQARRRYGIDGVVTGAIESVYQAERVQRICDRLGMWCFNPLWKMSQERLLCEILENGIKAIISGVFACPLDERWLGREIDTAVVEELVELGGRYKISPSGEGGEIETTVLDAPFFKKRVEIVEAKKSFRGNSGVYKIQKARLARK